MNPRLPYADAIVDTGWKSEGNYYPYVTFNLVSNKHFCARCYEQMCIYFKNYEWFHLYQ